MLELIAATLELKSGRPREARIAAVRMLGGSSNPNTKTLLLSALESEKDDELASPPRGADEPARGRGTPRLGRARRDPVRRRGLGSILLLAALGLAITYGLMGVINMAHGELIMIGAYTTYVVQNLFRALTRRAHSTGIWPARCRRRLSPPLSAWRSSAA